MHVTLLAQIAVSGGLGAAAGALSGYLGLGGAAVLPPMLAVTLGMEQHRAQGVSLAALLPPVGLPAVLAYRRSGVRIDLRLVALLVAGFLGGAAGGAWGAHRVQDEALSWIFAAFLALSAVRALTAKPEEEAPDSVRERVRWAGLPIGVFAGALSGLLGVGGGLVALPLLRKFVGLGRLEAQATTLAMMLPPIGLPAVLVYAREQGGLPWPLLAAVALGFAGGGWIGAKGAGRAQPRHAAWAYGGFLIVMAGVVAWRAW